MFQETAYFIETQARFLPYQWPNFNILNFKYVFKVTAGSDVRIALSEGENGARGGDTNFYTIVLGEWDNTRSVLHR